MPFTELALGGFFDRMVEARGDADFIVYPDRNTRYRAIVPGTSLKASVSISVYARTKVSVKALPLAQARISIVVFHPRDLRWRSSGRSDWAAITARALSLAGGAAQHHHPDIACTHRQLSGPRGRG